MYNMTSDGIKLTQKEEVELQFSNEGELKVHTKKEQKELLQKRKKAKKERRKERKKLEQTTATGELVCLVMIVRVYQKKNNQILHYMMIYYMYIYIYI